MSIGEALAEARRRAGLTIADVSQRTRIRETIIRGIESDDYSACGGDFYARGHIRSIARAAGADPEPLIREYDATQRSPQSMTAAQAFEPARPLSPAGERERPRVNWAIFLVVVLALALGYLVYQFIASAFAFGSHRGPAHPPAASGAQPRHHTAPATSPPAPTATHTSAATARPTPRARALKPVGVSAFGPGGVAQGDNPERAPSAIDHSPATAWHSDWYTTAGFGNLQRGTGLLVKLGHSQTIAAARVLLGAAPGASLQLRVGSVPALAGLPPVARAADAHGTVILRPAHPARGRYALIWFTKLPPDSAGTFQVNVSDIKLRGYR